MLRKILVGVGSVVFLLLGFMGTEAEELGKEPFLYTQDFEEVDPVEFWATDGKYTVNFKGLTEEKSFSGKKSFKLDVTFEKGSYFCWSIPIRVPAEGKLKFSGRILLGEESTRTAGLGANVSFRPYESGCGPFASYGPTKGEWKLIEGDLVGYGKRIAGGAIPKYVWGAKGENVGVYADRIGLFLRGGKGQRVVVYVDDIKIEGEVPTAKAYREEIKKRRASARERFDQKMSSWEEALALAEKELNALVNLSPEAENMRKAVEEKITSLKKKVEETRKRGYIDPRDKIDPSLEQLKNMINNVKSISEGRMTSKDLLLYVVSPISSLKILPFDTYIPGEISNEIRIVASPGEYEPGSFVVSALSDIASLKVEVTDLKGKKDVIPSKNIDIKIVKCWYQAGSAWVDIGQDKSKRVLVPELLLNDATLIKVDHEKERNYLKLHFPEGEKYIWISDPEGEMAPVGRTILSIKDFPVKDAPTLLPVDIPAKTNKQFWLTVKVPEKAEPGIYDGKITLSNAKEVLACINLKVRVLPIKLSPPYYTSSIYYRGILHPDWPEGSISSEFKSKEQLRAELKNMFSHGVTNPTVYQGFDKKLLGEYLRIRNEIGMGGKPLYYLGLEWGFPPQDKVKEVIEFAKSYGIPEVYFHGKDEAKGEALKLQRPAWEDIREAGGKVFVAGYTAQMHPPGNFALMGDIQDLLICAGHPSEEEVAKWHSVGHKIFCYANPQGGVENPEIYRRNFGLLLWKYNYDGAMTYAYQHSTGNIWNDFDDPVYRDTNFTYPTVDGVINTIALAGYREGVDDIRYATTLKLEIEKAKSSMDRRIREKATQAEKYLEELDTSRDLDTIRLEIINYILTLSGREK